MSRLILVRHGETDWNRKRVFRGRANIALNRLGREQAQAAGGVLSSMVVNRVVSSPLHRAKGTAQPVCFAHGLSLETDEGLIDIDYGRWEGLTEDAVGDRWPELLKTWRDSPHRVRFPDGENLKEVQVRGLRVIQDIGDSVGDGVAVIFTHRVVLKAVVLALQGKGLDEFWELFFSNGSITEFCKEDDGWRQVRLNDTEHLANVDTLDVDF